MFGRVFNALMINVPYYIETSQLISIANQLTVFHMMGNIARLWINASLIKYSISAIQINNKISNKQQSCTTEMHRHQFSLLLRTFLIKQLDIIILSLGCERCPGNSSCLMQKNHETSCRCNKGFISRGNTCKGNEQFIFLSSSISHL